MNLYTITIDFEDRTRAVMQVDGKDEVEALAKALRESEALEIYARVALEETIEKFLILTHLAMGYKGVWLWHHVNFDSEAVTDIYGGVVIQTDKNGTIRESNSFGAQV